MHALPPWIVFHVPHDSFYIPPEVRRGILLSDAELDREFLFNKTYSKLLILGFH